MLRLYDYAKSGNCCKVRLLLCQTGTPFERVRTQPGHIAISDPAGRLVAWP